MKLKKIMIAVALCVAAITSQAGTLTLVSPGTTTNVLVGITNFQNGVVIPAGTNIYNMPVIGSGNTTTIIASQANTNQWPSAAFSLTGYPNTLYGPANNLGLFTVLNLTATNSSATAITIHWAGSDGNYWISNYFVETITIPVNTLQVTFFTNITTGALPFAALQQIDNPGANALTNLFQSETEKPGL